MSRTKNKKQTRKPTAQKCRGSDDRIRRTLELFPSLPDDAQVEIRVLSHIYGRSVASLWRDLAAGRIPSPRRIGNRCTRWRVGDIRTSIGALRHAS